MIPISLSIDRHAGLKSMKGMNWLKKSVPVKGKAPGTGAKV
jgi:hypothetical protein